MISGEKLLWCADFILDLKWYSDRHNDLGEPQARSECQVTDPDARVEFLIYGDEGAVRHLRILINVPSYEMANKILGANIQAWQSGLAVSALINTPNTARPAKLAPNYNGFAVYLHEGGVNSPGIIIQPQIQTKPADLGGVAITLARWKPDYRVHLFYLERFLDHNLPMDMRWLNGYRVLEWHFRRGKAELSKSQEWRKFLDLEGYALDELLGPHKNRVGLIEAIRAQAAHAILSRTADPRTLEGKTTVLVRSFIALEHLVTLVVRDAGEGIVLSTLSHTKPRH